MNTQNRTRATFLAVIGGYVIYLAYGLLRDLFAGENTMAEWACILFSVILGGGGIAVLVLAWTIFRAKEPEEEQETDHPDTLK